MDTVASSIVSREIVSSIHSFDKEVWDKVVDSKNIYLCYDYLCALEDAMVNEMDFYYSISYDQFNSPVLISAFQVASFEDRKKRNTQLSDQFCKLKSRVLSLNILVCGNVFSDGENGFIYSDSLSKKNAIIELNYISNEIKGSCRSKKRISVILFKEFWAKKNTYSKSFKKQSFREFMIDVNMILPIHSNWNSFSDYLSSLKTKYRTRAKGVYKKSKQIIIKDLSSEEIAHSKEEIGVLFDNVVNNSNFSLGSLNPIAFSKIKEALGNQFIFRGAFLENKMVGFCTSFFHNNILEANYVGIDYEHNQDMAIYQRLLYEYVELSIQLDAKELQLGRTSELIKSAIGAVPENMKLYAKHRSLLPNILLKPVFHFISPSKFELRKPFKSDYTFS